MYIGYGCKIFLGGLLGLCFSQVCPKVLFCLEGFFFGPWTERNIKPLPGYANKPLPQG